MVIKSKDIWPIRRQDTLYYIKYQPQRLSLRRVHLEANARLGNERHRIGEDIVYYPIEI